MCTYDDSPRYIHSHNNLSGKNTYIPRSEDHMRSRLYYHMIRKDFSSGQVPNLVRKDLMIRTEISWKETIHSRQLLLFTNKEMYAIGHWNKDLFYLAAGILKKQKEIWR